MLWENLHPIALASGEEAKATNKADPALRTDSQDALGYENSKDIRPDFWPGMLLLELTSYVYSSLVRKPTPIHLESRSVPLNGNSRVGGNPDFSPFSLSHSMQKGTVYPESTNVSPQHSTVLNAEIELTPRNPHSNVLLSR